MHFYVDTFKWGIVCSLPYKSYLLHQILSEKLFHELYITGYQALLLKSLKKHVEKRTYLIKIHSHFLRCAEPTAQWIVLLVCALDVYIHTKYTSRTQTKSAMHCAVALAHLKCESVFVMKWYMKKGL